MDIKKISDGEYKLMELIWTESNLRASEISEKAKVEFGWSVNTTYTVLTKLVKKGVLERIDPGFICTAIVTKEQVQIEKTKVLLDMFYRGSLKMLLTTLLKEENLSEAETEELLQIIKDSKKGGG